MKEIIIDATGKSPGRVATDVVRFLVGKDQPSYAPNRLPDLSVVVTNAQAIRVSGHAVKTKKYRRHSGAPGGFREESFPVVFEKKLEEIIRRAVFGMLPSNRLRAQALRRLHIFKGEAPKA